MQIARERAAYNKADPACIEEISAPAVLRHCMEAAGFAAVLAVSLTERGSRQARTLCTRASLTQAGFLLAKILCDLTRVTLAHAIAYAGRACSIQAQCDCLPVGTGPVPCRTIAAFRKRTRCRNQNRQNDRADSSRKSAG